MANTKNTHCRDIEWHKSCLMNMVERKKSILQERDKMENNIFRLTKEINEYFEKIALAEAQGKTSFDRNRFGIKKKNEETIDLATD